jgi:hypothetical protein
MIIPPDTNGWSYDASTGNWKLVYADKLIVLYEQTDQSIATQNILFVGTEQECEDQIILLDLKYPDQEDSEI